MIAVFRFLHAVGLALIAANAALPKRDAFVIIVDELTDFLITVVGACKSFAEDLFQLCIFNLSLVLHTIIILLY